MNKWQVNIKILQVNIKLWQDDIKIWQDNIQHNYLTSDGRSIPPYSGSQEIRHKMLLNIHVPEADQFPDEEIIPTFEYSTIISNIPSYVNIVLLLQSVFMYSCIKEWFLKCFMQYPSNGLHRGIQLKIVFNL